MDIKELKPTSIWHYFDAITGVPRPSKKEERIREFLLNFAKEQNLEVKVDKTGNVVITKEATPGCEGAPTVILQAHMDMVCEKNGDVKHDFERDPIETYIDGEWVKARGTTLGADNGIGMAAAMAVLADKELKHGRIQALFTVDEETGLTGAFGLESGMIDGKYLLNLDSEDGAVSEGKNANPAERALLQHCRELHRPTRRRGTSGDIGRRVCDTVLQLEHDIRVLHRE